MKRKLTSADYEEEQQKKKRKEKSPEKPCLDCAAMCFDVQKAKVLNDLLIRPTTRILFFIYIYFIV